MDNMPSKSGVVVFAVIFIFLFWIYRHMKGIPATFSTQDIGSGQGVRAPDGWFNPNAGEQDNDNYSGHYHRSYMFGEPIYQQPTVIQHGRRVPWYKFIHKTTYQQKPPYLEKPLYR